MGIGPTASWPRRLQALLPQNIWAWVSNYLKYVFNKKHPFATYDGATDKGVYALGGDAAAAGAAAGAEAAASAGAAAGAIRMSIAGDWASGTAESYRVAQQMRAFNPHFTIHLGDVYYVGDETAVKQEFLGEAVNRDQPITWPRGSSGSFALNGNHEMYANGNAYFDEILPWLGMSTATAGAHAGQKASYFCLMNAWWAVIGIDTGYNSTGLPILNQIPLINKIPGVGPSCKLEPPLLAWLGNEVAPRLGGRGIILLSHHQYCSAFDDGIPLPARQMHACLPRPVLWYWGHEHRLAVYDRYAMRDGLAAFGRCIGQGGMPVEQGQKPRQGDARALLWDDRVYETIDGSAVGFNGYANLTFEGNRLTVEHRDLTGSLLITERWHTDAGQLTLLELRRDNLQISAAT
ncbi:MAG: metallophosphoesterase [Gemmatimonadales bacterium]